MRKKQIIEIEETEMEESKSSILNIPEKIDSNALMMQELKRISARIDKLDTNDDLELNYSNPANVAQKQHSQMLNISQEEIDSFGDSIELTTKSRLSNNQESFDVALKFTEREYHNMIGNRYGKHSKLIPVLDSQGKRTTIDKMFFSGSEIKIININGKEYYKIRLLVYDILIKKLLLARIPTKDGSARQEEIQLASAKNAGNQRLSTEIGNIQPANPVQYGTNQPGQTMNTLYGQNQNQEK